MSRDHTLRLAASPGSVAQARRFVESALAGMGRPALTDIATLLTSELVTNAVLHARTEAEVEVGETGGRLRVAVRDLGRGTPVVKDYALNAGTGRGLKLVEALSLSWGVERTEPGKKVWFELGADAPTVEPPDVDLADWADLDDISPTSAPPRR